MVSRMHTGLETVIAMRRINRYSPVHVEQDGVYGDCDHSLHSGSSGYEKNRDMKMQEQWNSSSPIKGTLPVRWLPELLYRASLLPSLDGKLRFRDTLLACE
jgi:hypothetical protein